MLSQKARQESYPVFDPCGSQNLTPLYQDLLQAAEKHGFTGYIRVYLEFGLVVWKNYAYS
jgi:hypothetical protein